MILGFDGDFVWGEIGDFAFQVFGVVFIFSDCKNTSEVAGVELAEEQRFLVLGKVGM